MWVSTLNERRKLPVPMGARMLRGWKRPSDFGQMWFASLHPTPEGGLARGVALFDQHTEAKTRWALPAPLGLTQLGAPKIVENLPAPPDWLLPIPSELARTAGWSPHENISWQWVNDGFLLISEVDMIAALKAGWSAFPPFPKLAPMTPALEQEVKDAFRYLKAKRQMRADAGPVKPLWEGLNSEVNPAPPTEELRLSDLVFAVRIALDARKRAGKTRILR